LARSPVRTICLTFFSRTGDADYLSRQYVERKEKDAIKDMLSGTVHEDKIELLEEYGKRESLEAKIVKDADTIDLALEVVENKYKGHSVGTIWNKNRQKYVYPTLFTKTAKKFWNEIHKANPHDWHLNGRNRFNAGDWKRK
jgi:5'-deoxynucleotidase YfbR-like HD superfamily hydrolase